MDSWYKLRAAGVRDVVVRRLMKTLEDYEKVFLLDDAQLSVYYRADQEDINRIRTSREIDLAREEVLLKEMDMRVVSLKERGYPYFLKNIAKPPLFLYIRGRGEFPQRSIAIVGTRKMTAYGRSCSEKISGELADAGICIVSGLASGIDGAAHGKVLARKGYTIAVVGSGLDVVYPRENRELWDRIGREGTLVSEYPPGTKPEAYHFPERNRIIAGLSMGVVVVESREKGGSLITATLALDEGRDVYAVPGDIFSPSSAGCNNFIRESRAKLITSGREILDEYGWKAREGKGPAMRDLSPEEDKVFKALKRECNLDELIMDTGMGAGELLACLMELELKGMVCGAPGGRYRRRVVSFQP